MSHIAIKLNETFLDLPKDLKLRIRNRGPLFNREFIPRSYTYPFKLDPTPTNMAAFGFRNKLEISKRRYDDSVELYIMGSLYSSDSVMYVRNFTNDQFDVDILMDLGALDDSIEGKTLKDIDYGPTEELGATTGDVLDLAKTKSLTANSSNKYCFPTIRNIGFYKDKNTSFGMYYNHIVYMSATKVISPPGDYKKWLDGDTITIEYYLVEEDETKTITLTTRDDPDTSIDEISSGLDPDVPGTGFPAMFSLTKWIKHIQIQLNDIKDFSDHFDISYIDFLFADGLQIRCKETTDKIRIVNFSISSVNWDTIFDHRNTEFRQSFLNYYYEDEFIEDAKIQSGQLGAQRHYTMCPFLYLSFMHDSIFNSLSIPFENKFASNSEIDTLILYQNFALDERINRNNILMKSFEYSQIVPDVDVKKFLLAINQLFCLVIYKERITGKYFLKPLKDIASDASYEDWNSFEMLAKRIDKEFLFEEGIVLSMNHDTADELANERQLAIDDRVLKDSVADLASLPAVGNTKNDIRLVEDIQKYYTVDDDLVTWNYYSDNFYPYKIPDENIKINTEIGTMHMSTVKSEKHEFEWLVPESNQPGSSNEFDLGINSYGLKLLFFRGMQENSLGDDYPLASSDVFNYNGDKIGNFRLTWGGSEGLYNVWWKDWYTILNAAEKTTTYFRIPINRLMNFDFTKKITFKNQVFFADEIEFLIENDKGITEQKQTLYRI